MKTKTKRLFAVILSAAVALSSTALAALAESTATPSEAETGPAQTEETKPPVSGDQQEDALPQEGMQETATEVTAPVELPVVQPSGEDGETPEPDAADQGENETGLPGQEDGPEQPTVPEGEEVQPEETEQPVEQPAPVYESAYAYVAAGTILYADAQRTVRLGTLAAETALRAKNVGDYEHGSVYEVLFDTYKTAGTERWETAYFYTSDIRRLTEAQSEALVGVRTVNGAKVVYADFYYYNEENVPEDGGEHEEEAEEISGAHTNTNSVNLRRDAKKSADMIAQLRKGTPVTIIEAVANSAGETWYKVRCEAGTGYILSSLIDGAGSVAVAGQDEETDATVEETVEPEESAEPVEIVEPVESTEPEESAEPEESTEPVETVEPEESTEPVETVKPEESAEPVEGTEPEQPAEEDELFVPEEEDLIFVPVESAEPVVKTDPDDVDILFIPINKDMEENPESELEENGELTEGEEMPALERSVQITANSDTQTLQIGSRITLNAELTGYEGVHYTSCWQSAAADRDGNIIGEWQTVQTDTLSLTYELSEENLLTAWRMSVTVNE